MVVMVSDRWCQWWWRIDITSGRRKTTKLWSVFNLQPYTIGYRFLPVHALWMKMMIQKTAIQCIGKDQKVTNSWVSAVK